MTSAAIPLSGIGDALRAALQHQIERDLDTLQDVIALEVGHRVLMDAIEATDIEGLVHLGQYKAAWEVDTVLGGAEVRNDAPYSGVIEHGRRPNRPGPPLAPILEWVERKLVPNGQVEPEEAEKVARAIRQAIHVRGTPPRFILRDALSDVERYMAEAIRLHLPTRP